MENVKDKFLRYISFDTQSDEDSSTFPSTAKQLNFARQLRQECISIGLKNIKISDKGYVYAKLSKNTDGFPAIGFISHMDTSPDASGNGVKPNIIEKYDGRPIQLKNAILSCEDFPELKNYIGEEIITTDGTTLLGADDKAGIAEIMTAVERIKHSNVPHGDICIAFTPDEEVGHGADYFDVKKFGAEFAYTVDGGKIGELECENFNAARAKITIRGRNVHPGYAKGIMINAALIGTELAALLPENEIPAKTEKYEGFYHLCSFSGTVEECKITYIIRDFDRDSFEKRKDIIKQAVEKINKKYNGAVSVELYDEYYNMMEKLEDHENIILLAQQAMEKCGVVPIKQPIRGGTDGARLSFMGLPCPNLFAGGCNFHGIYEFVPVKSMEKAADVIVEICKNAKNII
ncbi:MAG: peptidase T [Clostridia bacterium]|jgi:tripeptide aminopeptidase|nr:peptidase T [Clostridia bacterium]MCI2000204.1 peptidase T [Clostridia bacterium]MCI2014631.1 peptidase T [Clostridia bacterium]